MSSSRTITYPDSLYFNALIERINAAQESIVVVMFLFRTDYVGGSNVNG